MAMDPGEGNQPPAQGPRPRQVFMPGDLPPGLEPLPGPPPQEPRQGARRNGPIAIRRKVLTGTDENGNPFSPGAATYALVDMGMRDGCAGIACSTDGLIAIYTSHDDTSIDLSDAPPPIQDAAQQFIASLANLAEKMPTGQDQGFPLHRYGRLWLRQNGEIRGITGSAEILENNLMPFSKPFKLALQVFAYASSVTPGPANSPSPSATAPITRAVVLRQGALSGTDENGRPAAPGSELVAMIDMGVVGGCVSVACFASGATSIYIYQDGQGLDLGLSRTSPDVASLSRDLRDGMATLPAGLPWTADTRYPIAKEARFYRRTSDGVLGASIPAAAARDPQFPLSGLFGSGTALVKLAYPAAWRAVASAFSLS